MKLQDFLNSYMGTALGLGVSWMVKPRVGYPLARTIADVIVSRKRSLFVRSVRANQWVVHNHQLTAQQLNDLVHQTFRSAARSLYEFWHFFTEPQVVMGMVDFDPSAQECFRRAREEKTGTIMVAPHICNFDLVARALVLQGLNLHILSYPQPTSGYRHQNRLRQLPGMRVTPMSIQALREASETLRANRTLLTGVDRPLPEGPDAKYRPRFFGRPAAMPVFYIRLAIKHNLPITVLGGCRKTDGRYRVWASDPIPMQRHPDLLQETVQNSEQVLSLIAENIRKAPDQWAMFYPVWPEVLDQAPLG